MTKQAIHLDTIDEFVDNIERIMANREGPLVIALDGPSGSGKSTVAGALETQLEVALIPLDDFFSANVPDSHWDEFSIQERREKVFQWDRLIDECVEPLLSGFPARWRAFDFESGIQEDGTYLMEETVKERQPADVIVIDGAYSTGPELADFVDLAVLVQTPKEERLSRLRRRDGVEFSRDWHRRWEAVENYYFQEMRPVEYFDLVVSGNLVDA